MSCLQVTVHAGRDLKKQGWLDKLDPYVTITVGENVLKGKKQSNAGKETLFGDTMTIEWDKETPLQISVDDDDVARDDHVGTAVISPDSLKQPSWHGWLPIKHEDDDAGELLVTTVCMNSD